MGWLNVTITCICRSQTSKLGCRFSFFAVFSSCGRVLVGCFLHVVSDDWVSVSDSQQNDGEQ
jgi:hypothetical protein